MKLETFDLLKPVIDSIPNTFKGVGIVDNANGTYTITSSNTLWLSPGFYVAIGGVEYKILSIVANESIIIKGASLPITSTFTIYRPFFVHGTIIATNEELKAKNLSKNKFPMIYLHEITRERHYHSADSILDRESDCDIYFLVDADFETWLTNDHYANAIKPMRNLVSMFIVALTSNQSLISDFDTYETFDHAKFGVYFADKGHTKNIFDDRLSGVQVRISIPFIKNTNCIC